MAFVVYANEEGILERGPFFLFMVITKKAPCVCSETLGALYFLKKIGFDQVST